MVQNGCSFHRLRSEDPNQHLKDFLKLVDSLDLDGENRERTRLHLFQFSLCDQASNWLERLPVGSITTHEDLTTRFLARFFPPGRTAKLRNDILMFQPYHGESLSENDPSDFVKPVKAIALPQDVLSTSDHHLIELENQVQCLMEAHIAPTQPTQVNKVTTSCEIYSGPYDTQYRTEGPEQAFVEYASSHDNNIGNWMFTANQGLRNFSEATNTWKDKPNFNWERTQTFMSQQNGSISTHSYNYQMKLKKALTNFDSHLEKRLTSLRTQLGQQQDDMIGKNNLLWKTIYEKLNDAPIFESAGNSMASENIASISHIEREELRRKGIKIPSKLLSLKYLSSASITELNKNPSSPKRVHFVNLIFILSKESKAEEGETTTDITPEYGHNITKEVKGKVKEVMEEDKSEVETD
ncbi:MAK10-like protein [Tanacetum coccineum]|uniref:MAK10-like protein n=1 Tax=Tanacetum coccineum TaxID=301880 RepID=A0ABQ5DBQ5_9ASTR